MFRTDPVQTIATLLVLFLGIGLHEYAHCKVADMAGDPTPRNYGRVTLNLFKHFDPMGAMMIVLTTFYGFGIGWGRPAPMDPAKMRDPRWDFFAAVLAGPVSNVLQACVYALCLKVMQFGGMDQGGPVGFFFVLGVLVNLRLAFFNLIPLGPLDGHWLLGLLMPESVRYKWFQFNRTTGMYLVLGLVLLGQFLGPFSPITWLITFPSNALAKLLLTPYWQQALFGR
jgi:Zn-dependent protease